MAAISISPEASSRLIPFRERSSGVAFKIDNGCCGGTTLLLIDASFLGSGDVRVGEVDEVGVYVERSLVRSYQSDSYHIDVRVGARDSGFSIEVPFGFKFLMTRTVDGTAGGGGAEECSVAPRSRGAGSIGTAH
jgi:uncharacterized protein (DUF779 family)